MTTPSARGVPLPYLRAWRMRMLVSQAELARQCGMTKATITRAEKGDEVVAFTTIRRLAECLGISAHDLVNKNPEGGN